jgi:exonuclease III
VRWRLTSPNPGASLYAPPLINPRLLVDIHSLPKLTYSAQNCNSLNISTICDKQLKKIAAIISLDTDIIFLSDIRLNCANEHINKIVKMFRYNKGKSYEFFYNSTMNKRGVGILISTTQQFTVSNILKDVDENILGVTVTLGTNKIRFFSIYGPNNNDRSFTNNLAEFLKLDPGTPVIIGGDWNATYSCMYGGNNIDTYSMNSPPSVTRSMWLNQLCRDFFLCDPFRALHPSDRDFTFTPQGERRNRSRIDFFVVGEELINIVSKCFISMALTTTLFDHKSVHLDFKNEKSRSKMYINRTIITNTRTADIVAAAAADTYLHHATPGQLPRRTAQQHVFRQGHVMILRIKR